MINFTKRFENPLRNTFHRISEAAFLAKRTTGVVRWFDGSKGYGYIDAQDGEYVFVHYSALQPGSVPLLSAGDQVSFFLELTVRGAEATDVSRLN